MAYRERLVDVIVAQLTPEERIAEQERAVERYLKRLDHNQWRDPISGRIVGRTQRRGGIAVHQKYPRGR